MQNFAQFKMSLNKPYIYIKDAKKLQFFAK